ncbi:sugar transferase [Rhodobacteraceae bacterium W635]|uniref:sugar transferase n=1 Tax=Nioella halotolerans TaxID=2303578 RepID=UPI000E3E9FD9|nr:sugar transferase [Rhodobacteraceae bacterium W635]
MYERFGLYADEKAPHRILPLPPTGRGKAYHRYTKRGLDLVIVAFAAPVVMLIVGLAALVLVLRERGSPFYRQERIGLEGRVFGMWKLRTMVPNAEAVLDSYLDSNPEARAEWDRNQKLKNDPRITPFGRFLRRTSLDELPQLWNVLTGDMSIVGPRPMMRDQRVLYPGTEYYVMRPGITGLWQTSARNESSFHERAGFDQAYYRALSLRTDLAIIWRTFGVVLRGTGC